MQAQGLLCLQSQLFERIKSQKHGYRCDYGHSAFNGTDSQKHRDGFIHRCQHFKHAETLAGTFYVNPVKNPAAKHDSAK